MTQRRRFKREYDPLERVLPQAVLHASTLGGVVAHRDLRAYDRLSQDEARPSIIEIVESGETIPVNVEGWRRTGYLHLGASP